MFVVLDLAFVSTARKATAKIVLVAGKQNPFLPARHSLATGFILYTHRENLLIYFR